MNFKLKRVKGLIWINKKISSPFFKFLKIKDFRKNPNETITLKPSFNFNVNLSKYSIEINPFWKSFEILKSSPLFYSKIDQAKIISKGIVINKSKEVILESTIFQIEYLNNQNSNHIVVFNKILPTIIDTKVFSLLNKLDNNYYHWTLESLTRVLLVFEKPFFKDYKIVIKKEPLPFIKESLKFLFKINEEHIIEKPIYKKIESKEVLIVSFPHIRDHTTQNINVYYPFIIRRINELALKRLSEKNIEIKPLQNIIISRKKPNKRVMINEDELLLSLSKYNFKLVRLEKLSFLEQVTLFANANMVIATHGAGITNIIYSKNATIIELFPENRNIRDAFYFAQITAALEIEHDVILYKEQNERQDVLISDEIILKIKSILKTKIN